MSLLDDLRSRLQYKIIIPFLLLTLLVALTGSSLALLFFTGDAQERLTNNLAQLARSTSDSIVQIERSNLAFLREVAFAPANAAVRAPAVAAAVAGGDSAGLALALDPYQRVSGERGVRLDRLIVFDRAGRALYDWQGQEAGAGRGQSTGERRDLDGLWFVAAITAGRQDAQGDKYAGFVELDAATFLFTAVPVVGDDGALVGGIIAATRVDTLLQDLARRAQAAIVTVYRPDTGIALASSAAATSDLAELAVRPEVLEQVRGLQDDRRDQGVLDHVHVNARAYQVAYAPLSIRGSIVGLVSVGLAADYVLSPWANARLPLFLLTATLMAAIILLGVVIARQITRPLNDLVVTAEAVIDGDLERRSSISSHDEIGFLAGSFNAMTVHLLDMYHVVRAEAHQRAAIFESIADGIMVTTMEGRILMGNPALHRLLGLAPDAALPDHVDAIPLRRLSEAALSFGDAGAADLYHLGERIVRLNRSAISGEGGPGGFVFVFQDLTSAVAVDRAKTNFIATISHELRTPLTVITGNVDLILNGFMGEVPSQQHELLEVVRRYTGVTTALMNNMITIAKLDSGTMPVEPVALALADQLQAPLRTLRRSAAAKGLAVEVELPPGLPPVLADPHTLQMVLDQLLDNAQRYTRAGGVTIRAAVDGAAVRVAISDTGPGIEPDLREQLFTRFSRGSEGINSPVRGIGLGLAIARELLERQGGRIWLAETSEGGSTFCFTLPGTTTYHYVEENGAHPPTTT